MLRLFIGLLFLSSCSLGVVKKGGDKTYVYDSGRDYTTAELKELAPEIITTLKRDPQNKTLDQLFSKKQAPLKKIGLFVFESVIQPTLSGLANEDKIFLNPAGKQILTERLYTIWEQSFPLLSDKIILEKTSLIKKSKAFELNGSSVTNHVNSKRSILAPDDIFFLGKGKTTTNATVLNPRGMRDFSIALVPASEIMAGPKFSEHAKHAVNDLAKELGLDAVIIVMSKINWTAAHTDKHSGEVFPEEVSIKIASTVLVPLSSYTDRLKNLGEKRFFPNNTLAFRTYETAIKIPVKISVEPEKQNFEYIESELLNPTLKVYNDLTHMLQMQMVSDLESTQN